MPPVTVPHLLTAGRIAAESGIPLGRVQYILSTRPHIRPVARAGTLRLFDRQAISQVRYEANLIAARRSAREETADAQ